jgi:hypothetical protein
MSLISDAMAAASTYQKAPLETVPTVQSGMDEFNQAYNPGLDNILKANRTSLSNVVKMRSLEPSQIQNMINSGNLGLASNGVSSPDDLRFMSPEGVKSILDRGVNPLKSLSDTIDIADKIYNTKEAQKLAEAAAANELQYRVGGLNKAVTEGFDSQGKAEASNRLINAANNQGVNNTNQHNVTNQLANANLGLHRQSVDLQRAGHDLNVKKYENEVKAINQALGSGAGQAIRDSGGIFYNPELEKQAATDHNTLVDNKSTVPGWQKDLAYAKKLGYGGVKRGHILPLATTHALPNGRNYDYMVLGDQGWVYANLLPNGKIDPNQVDSGVAVPMYTSGSKLAGTAPGKGSNVLVGKKYQEGQPVFTNNNR